MEIGKSKEIDLGSDFGAVALKVNGIRLEIGADGKSLNIVSNAPVSVTVAANSNTPQTSTAIAAAQEAYKIGDRLKEGELTTVIFDFDENKDPIRVPENIFIGKTEHYNQDRAVADANDKYGLRGQQALTRLNDRECAQLAKVWDKVAPPSQQGNAAPWFWGELFNFYLGGRMYRSGADVWNSSNSGHGLRPVPAALRGPVRN